MRDAAREIAPPQGGISSIRRARLDLRRGRPGAGSRAPAAHATATSPRGSPSWPSPRSARRRRRSRRGSSASPPAAPAACCAKATACSSKCASTTAPRRASTTCARPGRGSSTSAPATRRSPSRQSPSELRQLSGVPGVAGVIPGAHPDRLANRPAPPAASSRRETCSSAPPKHGHPFGVDGSGVTVGILSDSFDQAEEAADESGPVATHQAEDVESGDLPGAANTCPGQATPVEHPRRLRRPKKARTRGGRWRQIVHDLAPGAQLAFATAFTGETGLRRKHRKTGEAVGEGGAGAKVIADDVSYFEEPFFQEGPVGVAVSKVTAGGVSLLLLRRQQQPDRRRQGHRLLGSAGIPRRRQLPGRACPNYAQHHCMDFNPGGHRSTPPSGSRVSPDATLSVDLQWAQPWNGVTTDLDAYLLNSADEVARGIRRTPTSPLTQQPFEFLPWTNTTGSAQTVRTRDQPLQTRSAADASGGDTDSPRLKFALLQNGGGVTATEYPESSRRATSSGRRSSATTAPKTRSASAAIRYNATEAPEPYSSRGPVTHYFEPVNGMTAAEPLGSPQSPLQAGPDGDRRRRQHLLRLLRQPDTWRFFGTSAAAPHAAAVAALELQAEPGATPQKIKPGPAGKRDPDRRVPGPRGRRRPGRRGRAIADLSGPPRPGSRPRRRPAPAPRTPEPVRTKANPKRRKKRTTVNPPPVVSAASRRIPKPAPQTLLPPAPAQADPHARP